MRVALLIIVIGYALGRFADWFICEALLGDNERD
jgi:hypothetical protein